MPIQKVAVSESGKSRQVIDTSSVLLCEGAISGSASYKVKAISKHRDLVLSTHLRLGKHIGKPTTDHAVCTARYEVVCVLSADHLHSVDWVGMTRSG